MTQKEVFDPKGLIKDAFAIDGISEPECRSIFLDWVLGVPNDSDVLAEVRVLIARYKADHTEDHPMIRTLSAALDASATPRRRGGRKTRMTGDAAAGENQT